MWGEFLVAHAWHLAVMAVLLLCSGFFSGSETALFSLSRGQLFRFRDGGRTRKLIAAMMARPQRLLNVLLLGNLLVNVAYAASSAVMIFELGRRGASAGTVALASPVPLLVLILAGEVTPKMLAYVLVERWSLAAAAPLAVIGRVFSAPLWLLETTVVWPLTRLLAPAAKGGAAITAEELGAVLALSAKRGIIDRDASALLQEIVELTGLRVARIMVPRVDMIAYNVDAPRPGLVELFRRTRLRKVPVYERDIDNVLGVVHAKRVLLNPDAPLRELIVKVPFVPEAAKVERVLLQLRVTRTQMAVVVDEYGGTAGLITLQDILEEIVGDIPDPDEADRGPAVQPVGPSEYHLDGNLAIHEWVDAFKMDLSGERISTVGGFVTSLLGRIPAVGDVVTYRNLRFTVESMRRHRIEKLRLRLLEERTP